MKEEGKIRKSFQLLKCSWNVLREHKSLMWFPVLSTLASLAVIVMLVGPLVAGVLGGMVGNLEWEGIASAIIKEMGRFAGGWVGWGLLFLAYWVSFAIANFFNTGLIAEASKALRGEAVSWKAGVRLAWSKRGVIMSWSALAATVGVIFSVIEEWLDDRLPVVGSLLARIPLILLGAAWTLVSVLVMPILVHEHVGPWEALKRSTVLLKRTWGENIVGRLSLSSAASLLMLAGVGFWLAASALPYVTGNPGAGKIIFLSGIPFLVMFGLALNYVTIALNGIFQAALYTYAVEGVVPTGYDRGVLEKFYQVK